MMEFDDEQDMQDFADLKRGNGYHILASELIYVNIKGERHYDLKTYGVYKLLKNFYLYVGFTIFEIVILIFILIKVI